ncbi:hypothetical protein F0U62_12320 [Cystobacter fuscus]|nr:hypothetical protein F0U62_12320 [Cystobacter fuscus]
MGLALLLMAGLLLLTGCATSAPLARGCTHACGGAALSFSEAEPRLAPFFACTSPAEYVALQQRVDMPRLLESLDDWSAVRLGALGPVREDAAAILQRKRAAFLLAVTERYGLAYAEVFALYVLHSTHDDELDALLRLLARDKLLGQTLGLMPTVREELKRRGLPLSAYPERGERAGDVLRGLGRAARDALATSQAIEGQRYLEMSARREQLPPPYRQALHEVELALAWQHFAPGRVVLGSFDSLTFGVPLGFYYLGVGTTQGLASLSQGQYEQATRELAPALLVGALYAGGKGLRTLPEPRLSALQEVVRQWNARLGVNGLRALARDIQASREAGRFVAVGGMDAALALHEARGDVARAQAVLSKARAEATGSPAKRVGSTGLPETLSSLVDEGVGLSREVLEARLALVELEATGPRLPKDVAVLEQQRPSVEAPPPGAEGNPRWPEYVAYYERRLGELRQGTATKGPLRWEPYESMRGWFTRGLAFERALLKLLRADAERPRAQRRFLGDFNQPRIETNVGVMKPGPGLRFADVLVIEEGELAGRPPRVETWSVKSRDLSALKYEALEAQMLEDAREALRNYGELLNIRRPSLQSLLTGSSEVRVSKVRLIYEGGNLKPKKVGDLDAAMNMVNEKVPGVEVLFQ